MVLATDEVYTYAIFNYININWSAHTEAGGDTTGGEGGVPAYVSTVNKQSYFIILIQGVSLNIRLPSGEDRVSLDKPISLVCFKI